MQAERLGVEIEVFLCAVCRHRQVVVAIDARHGHLLPEVCLSPRRFGQRTRSRSRSSYTNYFLLVVTCDKSRIQYRSLGLLAGAHDRLLLASGDGSVQAQRIDFLSTLSVIYNTFNRRAASDQGGPH